MVSDRKVLGDTGGQFGGLSLRISAAEAQHRSNMRAHRSTRLVAGPRRSRKGPKISRNSADIRRDQRHARGRRLEHDIGQRFCARGHDQKASQFEGLPHWQAGRETTRDGATPSRRACALRACLVRARADKHRARGSRPVAIRRGRSRRGACRCPWRRAIRRHREIRRRPGWARRGRIRRR